MFKYILLQRLFNSNFTVFDSDERTIHLAAKTEQLRDSWIEHLHIASYECLQLQLKSLRERLRSKTGKDPIENPDPTPMPTSSEGEPFKLTSF